MSKVAYLTIDDAPSSDTRAKVDFLEGLGIKAIWFCQGFLLEKYYEAGLYIIKHGHLIGNHSYDHPNFSEISLEECTSQIDRTEAIIEKLYQQAGIPRLQKHFRFPFLVQGQAVKEWRFFPEDPHVAKLQRVLRSRQFGAEFEGINYNWWAERGYNRCIDVQCTFDTFDWAVIESDPPYGYKGLSDLISRMDEDLPEDGRGLNREGSAEIVMLHDFPEIANLFQPLILKLVNKGLTFALPSTVRHSELAPDMLPQAEILAAEYLDEPPVNFRDAYSKNPKLFQATLVQNKVIGIAFGWPFFEDRTSQTKVILQGIAIQHDYSAKGYGGALLQSFENAVAEQGGATISIGSAGGYVEHFYEKHGYEAQAICLKFDKLRAPECKEFDFVREEVSQVVAYVNCKGFDRERFQQLRKQLNPIDACFIVEKQVG